MAENKTKYENVTIAVNITATSNKISEDHPQEVPTKTIYFTPLNQKDIELLEKWGMTYYKPNKDEKGFFITKATKKVKVYKDQENYIEKDFRITNDNGEINPNVYTEKPVYVSIVKVTTKEKSYTATYYRLQAVLSTQDEPFTEVEQTNPFADLFNENTELPF